MYDEAYKKYKNTKMADFWGAGTDEGKAMWAEYAKQMGLD
jgi:hypothetical protein